jgi:2-desacetyl-2-hydroxyethyl bacteriochlorophyllide A dehydrogenase
VPLQTHKIKVNLQMKALVCSKPGLLEYRDIDAPALKKDHSIVEIKNICICGTDLHAYEGVQPYFVYPRILGHELSGVLVECNGAPGFQKGDPVTFLPYINCGHCIACRNGKSNCCASLEVIGIHIDGGMADFLSIPSRLLMHASGLNMTELALVEPFAIGAHGIRRAAVVPEEFVLVAGAGPIGLGAMEFARVQGAKVIALDTNPGRLEFCKKTLGVSHIIEADKGEITEQLKEITQGDMPTVVIDATGNRNAINGGLEYVAHGGRYVLIGLQKGELVFSHPEFHKRETTLLSSRNATRADFDWVVQCFQEKKIHPLTFISKRVKFTDVASGMGDWVNPSGGFIKVVVEK